MRFPELVRIRDAYGFTRTRDPARGLARAFARDLARARAHGRALVIVLVISLVCGLVRVLVLVVRAPARDRALVRAFAIARARAPNLDFAFARALRIAYGTVRRVIEALEADQRERADTASTPRQTVRVALATRVAHGAVRILPAGSRSRYDGEFGSELYELAAAGVSWWGQVMYAVRLVDRAWVLRAELREAALRRVRS